MELVTSEFKFKNSVAVVVEQGVCFGEIRIAVAVLDWYVQVLSAIRLPFGNYQPSGNLEKKIDTTVPSIRLRDSLDAV